MNNGETLTPLHVNGAFMGFVVPPGKIDVHVWYSPMTFWVGVWIALATLAILIALSRVRERVARSAG